MDQLILKCITNATYKFMSAFCQKNRFRIQKQIYASNKEND